MKRAFTILVAAGFVFTPLPRVSTAGCRHVIVQKQAVVAYQPVTVPYYWSVGSQLQETAQAERIAAKVLQLLQGQAQQLQAQPCPDGSCPTPQTLPLTTAPDRWALTKQFCAGCHTTRDTAQEALSMADLSTLTCEQRITAVRKMIDGHMPPEGAKQPTAEQLGNLIGEWVNAETVGK